MSEISKKYIALQEELLEEVGKLYQFLVHESTPENIHWGHVDSASHALMLIRQVNQFYLGDTNEA